MSQIRKVVYNTCYGGFSISSEAAKLYRAYAEQEGVEVTSKILEDYIPFSWEEDEPYDTLRGGYDLERHDPILIRVVEELGSAKASGRFAKLDITEVVGQYRIDEYDGQESVMTQDCYEWS